MIFEISSVIRGALLEFQTFFPETSDWLVGSLRLMKNMCDDGAPRKVHSEKQMHGDVRFSRQAQRIPRCRRLTSAVQDISKELLHVKALSIARDKG